MYGQQSIKTSKKYLYDNPKIREPKRNSKKNKQAQQKNLSAF